MYTPVIGNKKREQGKASWKEAGENSVDCSVRGLLKIGKQKITRQNGFLLGRSAREPFLGEKGGYKEGWGGDAFRSALKL